MLEVAPFQAIRYDFDALGGDLSNLLAPPYDVLDRHDKQELLKRDEHNIVSIDLPHVPPKTAGPAALYEHAARLLGMWLDSGTLVRESTPSIYLYQQRFEHERSTLIRHMFIARVRLLPFTDGVILPHELTFGGPKEDRLALMKATRCQLSPIFGLYNDAENRVGNALSGATILDPDATGTLDGVENKLWIVSDHRSIDAVCSAMAKRKLYIADGHHRYGTALLYRDWLQKESGEPLPKNHPANFVMFVVASMDDMGCLILPYNRVLEKVDLKTVADAWSRGVEPADAKNADVVLFDGKTGSEAPLRFTRREELRKLNPNQCDPWYELDYAYLHRYLIDELLRRELSDAPKVHYVKSAGAAKSAAGELSGVALLTNATPMAHLRAISEAGGLMPQKSTYFHPKLATGLTINPLE